MPPSDPERSAAGLGAMTSGLTSLELTELVLAVLLVVIGVGLGLYARARLQRRKAQLLGELQRRPDLVQDRAFNRLAMTRREVELLARQGVDVGRARQQIAEAQASFDNRRYEQAYQTAQVVHESLVNARKDGVPLPAAPARSAPTAGAAAASTSKETAATGFSAPPMAKNRAESQFQLRLLDQELATARAGHTTSPATTEASELTRRAHAAFDRSDFTEAFRLALKGRRTLGGSVESLRPPPAGPPSSGVPAPTGPDGNGGTRSDPGEAAAKVAGADRCPECGYPTLAGDEFCRGCGRPRAPSSCPQCGTPRTPSDTFCGRCGARFV